MIHTKHLLKVSAVWTSIVYIICYTGVAMFSGIRPGFLMYALHMDVGTVENVTTPGAFISGLIIWNIVVFLAVWLFAILFNSIKK